MLCVCLCVLVFVWTSKCRTMYVCVGVCVNSKAYNCVYYTAGEISSANIAFGSANIARYYTVQQLIAQLSSARGETTVKYKTYTLTYMYVLMCWVFV